MITGFVFLILGGTLILSLFKGIFVMLGTDFQEEGLTLGKIVNIFKVPLLCFIGLILFLSFVLPYLEANGMQ